MWPAAYSASGRTSSTTTSPSRSRAPEVVAGDGAERAAVSEVVGGQLFEPGDVLLSGLSHGPPQLTDDRAGQRVVDPGALTAGLDQSGAQQTLQVLGGVGHGLVDLARPAPPPSARPGRARRRAPRGARWPAPWPTRPARRTGRPWLRGPTSASPPPPVFKISLDKASTQESYSRESIEYQPRRSSAMTVLVNTEELEAKVKDMYRHVAQQPQDRFHFELGAPVALRAGYDADRLADVPAGRGGVLRRGGPLLRPGRPPDRRGRGRPRQWLRDGRLLRRRPRRSRPATSTASTSPRSSSPRPVGSPTRPVSRRWSSARAASRHSRWPTPASTA